MVSNVLPQALCVIPRTHTRCMHKGLASSSAISHRPFTFQGLFCNSNSSYKVHRINFSFSVRAEAEVEGVVDDAVEVESVVESEQVEEKPPKQPRVKLGDIMGILNKKAIEANDSERPTPDLRVGDVVEIKLEVPENRRRLSVYKGIIMSKQNAGIHTTIRIRRVIAGVGVEIVFPVYSPNIKEIRVVSHRKVRRAKLYYLRDKLPRLSTFK